MTDLWVIVPACNEAARIGGTLRALAAQTDRDYSLVVVDNGSDDDTGQIVAGFATSAPFAVHLIAEPEQGIGYAVDTGFRYAIDHRATLLARTDADCIPQPGWVAAARAALDGGAGMACGRIVARRDEEGLAGRAAFRCLVAIAHSRAMTVENSTRRLRAYGLRRTAAWYLSRDNGGLTTDPR